ncbi:cupin domain-containing protein [Desulfosarcina sp. OttesenSCG-928-A07]|nr:cupin domain-containing protein [Desulfosarcina sp. OttesenSCG-928-G17]MDL2329341.1 cupin domain-containing protein [Desulfosarcina sp. OttesenSCG-928-A07]
MEFLKNILPETPVRLTDLISVRDGQIVSMALSRVENAQVALFALSASEMVSEEAYWGDTLYVVLSGELVVEKDQTRHIVSAGEMMAMPAHTGHALRADKDTKMLQITLNT